MCLCFLELNLKSSAERVAASEDAFKLGSKQEEWRSCQPFTLALTQISAHVNSGTSLVIIRGSVASVSVSWEMRRRARAPGPLVKAVNPGYAVRRVRR